MAASPNEIRQWWIYKITNPQGRYYIGKTANLSVRMSQYKTSSGGGCNQQPILYNSLLKYGFENHTVEVLDSFNSDLDYVDGKEMFWIRSFMSNLNKYREGNGMNLTDGGEGSIGAIWSDESKARGSAAQKGKIISEETKRKLSEYGKLNPSRGMLGKKHTQSAKDAMSKKKKGMVSVFKGKHHTEEYKKWASESRKGKPNLKARGKQLSEERKKQIGQSKIGNKYNVGRKHSKLSCENMSKAWVAISGIPILQFSLNGEFIKEYPALRVAEKETGIGHSNIKRIADGIINNPQKFIFKYKQS